MTRRTERASETRPQQGKGWLGKRDVQRDPGTSGTANGLICHRILFSNHFNFKALHYHAAGMKMRTAVRCSALPSTSLNPSPPLLSNSMSAELGIIYQLQNEFKHVLFPSFCSVCTDAFDLDLQITNLAFNQYFISPIRWTGIHPTLTHKMEFGNKCFFKSLKLCKVVDFFVLNISYRWCNNTNHYHHHNSNHTSVNGHKYKL